MPHTPTLMLRTVQSIALSLGLLLSTAQSQATDAPVQKAPPPVSVTVAKVSESVIPALVELAGTLQAEQRAAIAAKVTGVVTRVPVVLGSTVKAGDLLVAISAEEIAARLNLAEAQLAQAKRNLDREQNLLQKNAATTETVKSMTDMYAIAQAGYREAKTMLGYTSITAPFDGVVTRKNVNSGDLATPGTILLQIENSRKLQVATAVPESLIRTVQTGEVLTIKVPSANTTVQGTIAEIAPAVDPDSRTAALTIDLPPDPNLRAGMFARVMLPGSTDKTLLIPSAAVVVSGQMDKVFVADGDRAHLRLVRTGTTYDGMIEILSGLNPGEIVVISNNRLLVNGQTLHIQP